VTKIRANRPNPGLQRQHITGIKTAAALTHSEVRGLKVGSDSFEFEPRRLEGGNYRFDVGTAGSISLVIQTILPIALWARESTRIELTGGTDVKWSPPIDYLRFVYIPVLNRFLDARISISVQQRGHYPKGGGRIALEVCPLETTDYEIQMEIAGAPGRINGISHCVRLPPHVTKRQAQSCSRYLKEHRLEVGEIKIETYPKSQDTHLGPGSGIVVWVITDQGAVLGGDSIGERGKSAEKVGIEAARNLHSAIESGASADRFLGDMLIPFMVLSSKNSIISVSEITSHLLTNIEIAKRFVHREFKVTGNLGQSGVIQCSSAV